MWNAICFRGDKRENASHVSQIKLVFFHMETSLAVNGCLDSNTELAGLNWRFGREEGKSDRGNRRS